MHACIHLNCLSSRSCSVAGWGGSAPSPGASDIVTRFLSALETNLAIHGKMTDSHHEHESLCQSFAKAMLHRQQPHVLLLQVETQNRHWKDLVDPGITSAPVRPDLGDQSHMRCQPLLVRDRLKSSCGLQGSVSGGLQSKAVAQIWASSPTERDSPEGCGSGTGWRGASGANLVLVHAEHVSWSRTGEDENGLQLNPLPNLSKLGRTSCERPIAHHGRCLDGLFPVAKLCVQQFSTYADGKLQQVSQESKALAGCC